MTQTHSYDERYPSLLEVANALEAYLLDKLAHLTHIDRVQCRAKTPESFGKKADRQDDNGCLIYAAPLSQIQDQIGARVVVFYREDVRRVENVLEPLFSTAEHQTIEPQPRAFGYFGEHWVFALPNSIVPASISLDIVPEFFELQVKTLFQHAWSEAEHDIGYKSHHELSIGQQRLFAVAGALAWQADNVFAQLSTELSDKKTYRNPLLAFYCSPHRSNS